MIRANVCPYCDGRYGIAFGGCENDCRESRYVVAMIRAAPVCTHPPARLYSWRAWDGTWCVGCCVCGVVLVGAMTHADAQAVMQDDAVTP